MSQNRSTKIRISFLLWRRLVRFTLIVLFLLVTKSSLATEVRVFHSSNNHVLYELGINYDKIVAIKQLGSNAVVSRIVNPRFELKLNDEIIIKHVHANFFAMEFFCKKLNLGNFMVGVLSKEKYPHDSMLSVYNDVVSEMYLTQKHTIYTGIDCIN